MLMWQAEFAWALNLEQSMKSLRDFIFKIPKKVLVKFFIQGSHTSSFYHISEWLGLTIFLITGNYLENKIYYFEMRLLNCNDARVLYGRELLQNCSISSFSRGKQPATSQTAITLSNPPPI
jgi:hypothetical protein